VGTHKAISATENALNKFATTVHRSVAIEISMQGVNWTSNINGQDAYPAASLLKIPLALATEQMMAKGELDPKTRVSLKTLCENKNQNSILSAFSDTKFITLAEVLRFTLISSDEQCARFLRQIVPNELIKKVIAEANCESTFFSNELDVFSIDGMTTTLDALRLVSCATDQLKYPHCSFSLKSSILNSRIPVGVDPTKYEIFHKTGTLKGVANDVAHINSDQGFIRIAFLTKNQQDLIISGYEMGLCVRLILDAWNITPTGIVGFVR
jgi:beta-lactamase class A